MYWLPSADVEESELLDSEMQNPFRILAAKNSYHIRSSDSSTTAEDSQYGSTCARCCNYSLRVLLMMGDGITRNM